MAKPAVPAAARGQTVRLLVLAPQGKVIMAAAPALAMAAAAAAQVLRVAP
jgi:hypothetical protein